MENPIKQIYAAADKANLLKEPYSAREQALVQMLVALEGFDVLDIAVGLFNDDGFGMSAADLAVAILSKDSTTSDTDPITAIEKSATAVIFGVMGLAQLGLNVHDITKALNIVVRTANADTDPAVAAQRNTELRKLLSTAQVQE